MTLKIHVIQQHIALAHKIFHPLNYYILSYNLSFILFFYNFIYNCQPNYVIQIKHIHILSYKTIIKIFLIQNSFILTEKHYYKILTAQPTITVLRLLRI